MKLNDNPVTAMHLSANLPLVWSSASEPVLGFEMFQPVHHADGRGTLNKVFVSIKSPNVHVQEVFWSRSQRGVIRGMHVQIKPQAGRKLIWVSDGIITDVILDLRPASRTFGEWTAIHLSNQGGAVLVPEECAHGFLVESDTATVHYAQEHGYSPSTETGIRWDSFGFHWGVAAPILSQRDKQLPTFNEYLQAL